MIYSHTILVPKTLAFHPEYYECSKCGELLEKHIICEGARFHVHSYDTNGIHCSVLMCEDNHICKGVKDGKA